MSGKPRKNFHAGRLYPTKCCQEDEKKKKEDKEVIIQCGNKESFGDLDWCSISGILETKL